MDKYLKPPFGKPLSRTFGVSGFRGSVGGPGVCSPGSLEVRFDFGPRPGVSKQLFGNSRGGHRIGLDAEKKKAYTTITERKSFGELFWSQRKTFQAGGGYKNPIKTRKTISTTEIFPLWTPFFSAKKSSALEQGGVRFLFPNGRALNSS